VPLNVERYINIFLSNSILGGGDVVTEQGYQGHYASFDLKEHQEVTHINIEKMDSIHEQLITAIAQLATTPAQTKGEAAPLRYVVPPDAPVELWDSGTPQFARSGDTLQRLAALNHVPLWSLTQANQLSDKAPLAVGQRVIVPRRLVPLVATSAASIPKR
jgi:LysM repeat protein